MSQGKIEQDFNSFSDTKLVFLKGNSLFPEHQPPALQAMLSTLEFDEVVGLMPDYLSEYFRFCGFALLIPNSKGRSGIDCRVYTLTDFSSQDNNWQRFSLLSDSSSPLSTTSTTIPSSLSPGISLNVFNTRKTDFYSVDTSDKASHPGDIDLFLQIFSFSSALFLPVIIKDSVVSVICLFSNRISSGPEKYEVQSIEKLIVLPGSAINNAKRYGTLKLARNEATKQKRSLNRVLKQTVRKEEKIRLLDHLIQAVSLSLNLTDVLNAIREILKEQKYLFEGISLHLTDDASENLYLVDILNITGEHFESLGNLQEKLIPLNSRESAFSRTCQLKKPLYFYKVTEDMVKGIDKKYFDILSCNTVLMYPLIAQNQVFGVLTFFTISLHLSLEDRHFDDIQGYIDHVASSVRNAQLYMSLQSARDQLAKRSQELREEHEKLKHTQAQLVQSEKMASLGTLVSGVAHELNNPNNFINGGIANALSHMEEFKLFFKELIDEDTPEAIHEALDNKLNPISRNLATIQRGSERIQSIVAGLRTFSRLDESQYKEATIEESIQSVIVLVRANFKDQVHIVCEFEETPSLMCWPAELSQAFMNILVNACQAIVSKQKQTGDLSQGLLTISTTNTKNFVCIRFQDNGTGMDAETKRKMLDPFFTTKDVGEGTGLGMAIVFGIIKKHRGKIEVESEPGEGTIISIWLPVTN